MPSPVGEAFVARLDEVERRLAAHAGQAPPTGLTAPDPPTGERWEAGQVWAHMSEFVPFWLGQSRTILAADSPEPVPFGRVKSDPGRVAAIERDRGLAPAEQMLRLHGRIAEARVWIAELAPAAWSARGLHPTVGVMSIDRIVDDFVVGHLEQHADQLDSLRPEAGPAAPAVTGDGPRGLRRLLELQEVDLAIDRLNATITELEAQGELRQAREDSAAAEARVGEVSLAANEVAREQRRVEGDVDSFDQKMRAEERRLFDGSVANPRELQSLRAEVESIRNRKMRTEDRVLELMEQREQLEADLIPAEQVLAEARARLEEVERTSASDLVESKRRLGERAAQRLALLPEFDEDLLQLYEELRRSKRGVGVAALKDGVCQGCHQALSPVELDRLKRSSGLRRCDSCRRILIFG